MASVSHTVTIHQPVEKVFGYVIAVENHKDWQAGILEAKVTPEGPIAAGSVYQYKSEVMGYRMETKMRVSAFEPNRTWAIETTGVPQPVETVYPFEPAGQDTQLTISMELTGGYPAMAEAMVKEQMQKSLVEQGARVKQAVER